MSAELRTNTIGIRQPSAHTHISSNDRHEHTLTYRKTHGIRDETALIP